MKSQAILAILFIAMTNYVLASYCPVIPPISYPKQTSPAIYGYASSPTSQPTDMVYTPDTPEMSDAHPTSTPPYIPVTYPMDASSPHPSQMGTTCTTTSCTTTSTHTQTTSSKDSSHAVDATDSASASLEIGWGVWAMSLVVAGLVASFGVGIVL